MRFFVTYGTPTEITLLRGSCNFIVIQFEKIIIYLKVLSIARLKNAKKKNSIKRGNGTNNLILVLRTGHQISATEVSSSLVKTEFESNLQYRDIKTLRYREFFYNKIGIVFEVKI